MNSSLIGTEVWFIDHDAPIRGEAWFELMRGVVSEVRPYFAEPTESELYTVVHDNHSSTSGLAASDLFRDPFVAIAYERHLIREAKDMGDFVVRWQVPSLTPENRGKALRSRPTHDRLMANRRKALITQLNRMERTSKLLQEYRASQLTPSDDQTLEVVE